jgi:hypothetical protein
MIPDGVSTLFAILAVLPIPTCIGQPVGSFASVAFAFLGAGRLSATYACAGTNATSLNQFRSLSVH